MNHESFDRQLSRVTGFERVFGARIFARGDAATVVPMLDYAPPGAGGNDRSSK